MKTIAAYLDDAEKRGAARNDSDVARKIGVTRAAVSDWRNGRRTPDDEQAVKLAMLIGIEPGELLAECGALRAKSQVTRAAWEKVAARMAGATLGLLLLTSPFESPRAEIPLNSGTYCFQKLFTALFTMACLLRKALCRSKYPYPTAMYSA